MCNSLKGAIYAIFTVVTCLAQLSYAAELKLLLDDANKPILLTHADDSRIFMVEKTGKVFALNGTKKHLFLDVSSLITTRGSEQGLLSIVFHPKYSENGYLFLFYTAQNGDNTLARLTVDPPNAKQTNLQSLEVLVAQQDPASNHNGGMLAFGQDGYLYLGMGDGGRGGDPWDNAQNLKTFLGKMLRIDVNQASGYSIPKDNPFVERDNVLAEIWAYGLRNPWRHSFDRETGDLWIADVGQNKWEEIHWRAADSQGGENYGWRLMEGKHCFLPKKECNTGKLVMPVAEYGRKHGCSVTGGYVYRGSKVQELYGKYIFGDFCSGVIWSIEKDKKFEMRELLRTNLNISSFGEDSSGELYVLDYQGKVFKFVP
ncbi:MAG: glucose dehydrogenase [Gammaproteobacteria bacterium]|nr:MAG: glucose dehydrogenase [Gammaproteobacteria bacterium]